MSTFSSSIHGTASDLDVSAFAKPVRGSDVSQSLHARQCMISEQNTRQLSLLIVTDGLATAGLDSGGDRCAIFGPPASYQHYDLLATAGRAWTMGRKDSKQQVPVRRNVARHSVGKLSCRMRERQTTLQACLSTVCASSAPLTRVVGYDSSKRRICKSSFYAQQGCVRSAPKLFQLGAIHYIKEEMDS